MPTAETVLALVRERFEEPFKELCHALSYTEYLGADRRGNELWARLVGPEPEGCVENWMCLHWKLELELRFEDSGLVLPVRRFRGANKPDNIEGWKRLVAAIGNSGFPGFIVFAFRRILHLKDDGPFRLQAWIPVVVVYRNDLLGQNRFSLWFHNYGGSEPLEACVKLFGNGFRYIRRAIRSESKHAFVGDPSWFVEQWKKELSSVLVPIIPKLAAGAVDSIL